MTDKTQPEAGSTHIIRYALEMGLLWIDGDGRDKVREALDALDTLETQLESIGAGGVSALMGAASAGSDGVASLPLPGAQEAVPVLDRETLIDAIAQGLSGTYHCTRVWSAWSVGTMGEDDFCPVDESDTPAELADTVLALLATPQPALSAGWVSVKDRLPPPFDEVWVHPRPSDYCCEASVDTVGNWKYSEYETNFGVNHIKCTVEYWMQPPALPVEPSMDGESNADQA